uniref:Uncharacterized protein n=1 Tax=Odontella aurita TaxID=265563 RepID=A0A7S4MUT8_9STRA|mmetsp:Transcript_34052/g.101759  ORF Transcript_34052/g.101759 Transcript_34052/m.101759 type:complete len:142 (+) Transcript_34052:471-896(+)
MRKEPKGGVSAAWRRNRRMRGISGGSVAVSAGGPNDDGPRRWRLQQKCDGRKKKVLWWRRKGGGKVQLELVTGGGGNFRRRRRARGGGTKPRRFTTDIATPSRTRRECVVVVRAGRSVISHALRGELEPAPPTRVVLIVRG